MAYQAVFPDFSGFQVEIPGVAPSAEPRRRGCGSCTKKECMDFWPDAPGRDRAWPDEENG